VVQSTATAATTAPVPSPKPILAQLSPISNPPFPRGLAGAAYDPLTRQTVMFGGLSAEGTLPDTWSWDGLTWTQHHSAVSPHGRFDGLMAFDPAVGGIVLIGGNPNVPIDASTDADIRSTWVWQGSSWRRMATAHTPVPADYMFGWLGFMAYDAASRQLVLDGESGGPHIEVCTAETWTFNGTDWRRENPAEALPAPVRVLVGDGSAGSVLAVVSPRQAMVQRGFAMPTCQPGSFDARALPGTSTFAWTGSTWKQVSSNGPPVSQAGDAGGASFGFHAVLLTEDMELWTWNGSAWLQQAAVQAGPGQRSYAAFALDQNGRLLLFGGEIQAAPWDLGDTWLWDGQKWARVPVAGPPASASR
jgi:hypothetical protein